MRAFDTDQCNIHMETGMSFNILLYKILQVVPRGSALNQLFYTIIPRSGQAAIDDSQPTRYYNYSALKHVLCPQKTVLGFHPTAKTRADK